MEEEKTRGESARKQCAGGRAAWLNALTVKREDAMRMWKRMPGIIDNAVASRWLGPASAWCLKSVFNLQRDRRKPKSSARVSLDETSCLESSALWLGAWALLDHCDQERLQTLKTDAGIDAKSYVAQGTLSALEDQVEMLHDTQADLSTAWHQLWGEDVAPKVREDS